MDNRNTASPTQLDGRIRFAPSLQPYAGDSSLDGFPDRSLTLVQRNGDYCTPDWVFQIGQPGFRGRIVEIHNRNLTPLLSQFLIEP